MRELSELVEDFNRVIAKGTIGSAESDPFIDDDAFQLRARGVWGATIAEDFHCPLCRGSMEIKFKRDDPRHWFASCKSFPTCRGAHSQDYIRRVYDVS